MWWIIGFFLLHWYLSLFTQTFFLHRYSAHAMFSMSKGWEKVWFVLTWLFQGSSYLSPYAYGALHRMHHAYADTEKDPHSPRYDKNIFSMMLRTARRYQDILKKRVYVDAKFTKNLPDWRKFDLFAHSRWSRISWGVLYIGFYIAVIILAQLPLRTIALAVLLVPIHILMGPVHGAIINWFAHRIGYKNYKQSNDSKNMMPLDIVMMGEGLHNNHHGNPDSPNFAKNRREFDPVYPAIIVMKWIGIVKFENYEK